MRAVVVDQPGGIETLVVREVPEPVAGPDEVLIETAYCGCNWADLQRRQGTYPHPVDYPHIMGREVSGTVAALGADVAGLEVGDRVIAIPSSGGYAERCIAPARLVSRLPDAVPFDVGAAFQVQALTAYHMLHTLHATEPGETVLLHAAAGGVGLFAIQLAVRAGATVIGTVGTNGKENRVAVRRQLVYRLLHRNGIGTGVSNQDRIVFGTVDEFFHRVWVCHVHQTIATTLLRGRNDPALESLERLVARLGDTSLGYQWH